MLTPRENMIRTIRCEDAEWIPITAYVDPFNHPDPDSLPKDLRDLFREKVKDWNRRWELFIPLSEYLGVEEYMMNAQRPFDVAYTQDVEISERKEGRKHIHVIQTSSGPLTQVTESGFITKHYIEGPEDLVRFREYVESWKIEGNPDNISSNKQMKNSMRENGMICIFDQGTPLGMMYRVFADITQLIYMTADIPEELDALFAAMERKYLEMFEFTLINAPEIDIIVGMDDTSTTIISPAMFERYNVALTDKRTDLAHQYGKFYFHHSCGLIHDLLPVYRQTKMDGVHAFTPPPIGNVTYDEGRKLLGDKIVIDSNFQSGLDMPDLDTQVKVVNERMAEAQRARHIMLRLATPDYRHGVEFLQRGLEAARKYQKL